MIEDGTFEVLRANLADELASAQIKVTVIPSEDLGSRAFAALSRPRAE